MENIGVIEVQEDFQFTTSQGGRRLCLELEKQGKTFNSRPHKEVDRLIQVLLHQSDLSIHDLTRRSTEYICYKFACKFLSIHDLTRRST